MRDISSDPFIGGLAEAAKGMGFTRAAKTYYSRALEARKAEKTCNGMFNTCEGFDIPKLAGVGLASK